MYNLKKFNRVSIEVSIENKNIKTFETYDKLCSTLT